MAFQQKTFSILAFPSFHFSLTKSKYWHVLNTALPFRNVFVFVKIYLNISTNENLIFVNILQLFNEIPNRSEYMALPLCRILLELYIKKYQPCSIHTENLESRININLLFSLLELGKTALKQWKISTVRLFLSHPPSFASTSLSNMKPFLFLLP